MLYEGTSRVIDNRGLGIDADKREFYIEKGDLVVYRHSVSWCDEEGLKVLMGEHDGCGRLSPRKLKQLERIPVAVP